MNENIHENIKQICYNCLNMKVIRIYNGNLRASCIYHPKPFNTLPVRVPMAFKKSRTCQMWDDNTPLTEAEVAKL